MMDKAVICQFQAMIDNISATLGFCGRGRGDVLRRKLRTLETVRFENRRTVGSSLKPHEDEHARNKKIDQPI